MPKQSAGILLFRSGEFGLDVMLVHPGGPFWANKDLAAWSIPKGEFGPDEDALEAAKREFEEEIGQSVDGVFIELEPLHQPGGKLVYAWALESDCDVSEINSNSFPLEWPPKSGQIQQFPEIDRADWFRIGRAGLKILPGQTGFLDQLEALLVTD